MCCYFGCLKSWGLREHGFDWLENTTPHGGWWRLSISFLFKARSLLVTLFLIPVPRLQLRSRAHLQCTACQSLVLTWACPCTLSFLSVHAFGDPFSLFILMLRILITRLQDPQHLYLIKVFFFPHPLSTHYC